MLVFSILATLTTLLALFTCITITSGDTKQRFICGLSECLNSLHQIDTVRYGIYITLRKYTNVTPNRTYMQDMARECIFSRKKIFQYEIFIDSL